MDERVERTVDTYEDVAAEYQSRHDDRSDVAPVVEAFRERVEAAVTRDEDAVTRDEDAVTRDEDAVTRDEAASTGSGAAATGSETAATGDETGGDGRPRVVDVGCGPGWETATFRDAGFDVAGIDITPSFLAAARERAPDAGFVRGDMRTLPLASDVADGVFALASLLHVPVAEVDDALAEFERVLSPGGVCTVVTKAATRASRDSPYGERDRRHVEYYEPADLRDRVDAAGFDVETTTTEDGWILVHARPA